LGPEAASNRTCPLAVEQVRFTCGASVTAFVELRSVGGVRGYHLAAVDAELPPPILAGTQLPPLSRKAGVTLPEASVALLVSSSKESVGM